MPQLEEISVNFKGGKDIPTPTLIYNAGQWYLLDHLSSGLVYFDHTKKIFRPLIAESWESQSPLEYRFHLKTNVKFHDGSLLTAKDVAATIKNQLVAKTSTHFPLWEYLADCDDLTSISDDCAGVQLIDPFTIDFVFKKPMSSFYLQLASPETGIWSFEDLQEHKAGQFKPKKFSGPYYFDHTTSKEKPFIVLKRNEESPIIQEFKEAPKTIKSFNFNRSEAIRAFNTNQLDLLVDYYQPFPDENVDRENHQVHRSTPSMMTYLRSVGEKPTAKIGKDLIKKLWDTPHNQNIVNAVDFLTPGVPYNISQEEFLSSLPDQSSREITIGFISSFHTKEFANYLHSIGEDAGTRVSFKDLTYNEFIKYFERKESDLDFLLAPYAASERFPSVHLRFLTGPLKNIKPIFDLKLVETPGLDEDTIESLKQYQTWLLESQLAIPLYFHQTEIFYDNKIDIGEQPKTDAEFELWRVLQNKNHE